MDINVSFDSTAQIKLPLDDRCSLPTTLSNFLFNAYWFNHIYNISVLYPIFYLGLINYKQLDRGILEYFGPYGISNSVINLSNKMSNADSGQITSYAIYITISTIFLISLIFSYNLFGYELTNFFKLLIILLFTFFIDINLFKNTTKNFNKTYTL